MVKDFNRRIPHDEHDPKMIYGRSIWAMIDYLLDRAEENPFREVGDKEGMIVDFMAVGVSSKYVGKKVGYRLSDLAFENLVVKGYKYGCSFAIN